MILRDVQGYRVEKVKRNVEGSYAITYNGKKSLTQYNAGTLKKALLKMSDEEFVEYAKTLNYE